MIKKEMEKSSKEMVEEIKTDFRASADLGIKRCMQCGLCTSNCPAARHSDYDPREIVKKVLDNNWEILDSPDLWNCFYCYTCQCNCPVNNSPCQINQILRQKILLKNENKHRMCEFSSYGYSYLDFGVGAMPKSFFDGMVKDYGKKYLDLKVNLEDIRQDLDLDDYNLKGKSLKEVQDILQESGFKKRLKTFKEQ
ncbi:4Fe-4S dicluster domain-containing protein [Methanobacterium alcaliphilum]|uniref:4Fe-4S dicluster domain-containing protein n=1 Tax=Methanobacterium alcaliphilum TaxID=392018 RepID=UPI00200B2957|nr:4Fe-4S dicluster domain-containing protein [Methanobacterium alcaliphilum]MCK9150705.1 heterodisulfide reductase subunit C [Methanobacterium alcaliphilum]